MLLLPKLYRGMASLVPDVSDFLVLDVDDKPLRGGPSGTVRGGAPSLADYFEVER